MATGSTADPLVALAWFLLFGGPAAAAVLAGRRCRGPDGARPPYDVRVGQGIAAGVLANGLAAMFTIFLGTGTTLLMLKYPWLLHWFTHGHHLTAMATYRYELHAVNRAGPYGLMLISFPVIGLFMSSLTAVIANPAPASPVLSRVTAAGSSGPGPGPGPEPGAGAARRRAGGCGPRHCPGVIPLYCSRLPHPRASGSGHTYDLWRVSRVASGPEFSAQTLSVLAALCNQPSQWQHGYALARQTGLKSGTLYPILIRSWPTGAWWRPAGRTSRSRAGRGGTCTGAAWLASATGALASPARQKAIKGGADAGFGREGHQPGEFT